MMNMWLAPIFLLLSATAWRWSESVEFLRWVAGILSLAAIWSSWQGPAKRNVVLAVLAMGTVIAGIKLLPQAWPCELACQGLTAWSHIGPLPLAGLAAGLCFVLLLGVMAQIGAMLLCRVSWLMTGGSLAYVMLMLLLDSWCFHCLAVHSAILCLPGLLRPLARDGLRPQLSSSTAVSHVIIGLIMVTLINAQLTTVTPTSSTLQDDDLTEQLDAIEFRPDDQVISEAFRQQPQHDVFLLAADAGRRIGSHEAPWRLEVVVSLHCSHCRLRWPALRDELRPMVDQGLLQIVIRHRWQQHDPHQQAIMAALWCAAASQQHGPWLMRALAPAPQNEALNEQLQRKHQVHTAVQQMVSPGIERLLKLEQFWLAQHRLRSGPVPAGLLFRSGQAKPVTKLTGSWGAHDVRRYTEPVRE